MEASAMNPPYVEVIYDYTQRKDSIAIDLAYHCVQVVRAGEEAVKYGRTGEFEGDLAEAWADTLPLVPSLQNHDSVETFRKLKNAKPEERYVLLASAARKTTP
jgi:hypothetical protein